MPSKSLGSAPSEATVRERAYLMWEADGRPDGRSDHYWTLAQSEAAAPSRPPRVAASAKASVPEKKAKAAKPAKKKPKA